MCGSVRVGLGEVGQCECGLAGRLGVLVRERELRADREKEGEAGNQEDHGGSAGNYWWPRHKM